jgi:hypothetical protein
MWLVQRIQMDQQLGLSEYNAYFYFVMITKTEYQPDL